MIADTHAWFAGKGLAMTTEQVVSAAEYTCDQADAGADPDAIQPLTGDVDAEIVHTFVTSMIRAYCPKR